MNDCRFLVLLSTYNGEKFLVEQLDSIFFQKGIEVTLLIRDDGSQDNTLDLLYDYMKCHPSYKIIVKEEDNIGSAMSFYCLLLMAYELRNQYDFFAFSDQDDVWLEDKLKTAIDFFDPQCGKPQLYCSNLCVVDVRLQPLGMMRKPKSIYNKANALIESFATGCTFVFNREMVELFYKYKPKTLIHHDLWVFHSCLLLGNVYYDNNSYIYYRQHSSNVVGAKNTLFLRWRSRLRSLKTLKKQHYREHEAKELLRVYSDLLSLADRELVSFLALYKENFLNRISFFFAPVNPFCNLEKRQYKMISWMDDFWFRCRILLGAV